MGFSKRPKESNLGKPYVGPVVFVNGLHYPVGSDGHKEGDQPLVVEIIDGREVYIWGNEVSPHHNHVYERRVAEVVPFSEDPNG